MKKYISLFLAISLMLSALPLEVDAAVTRTITVTKEKIIPFSSTGSSSLTSVNLDVSGLSNIQIIDKYVDNGAITGTNISSGTLTVTLNNGTYSSQPKTLTKADTITLTNRKEDDTVNHTIAATAKGPVSSIIECTGDFLSSTYSNNQLNIKVDTNNGVNGLDNTQTVTDTLSFLSPNDNRNKLYATASQSLPYGIVGSPRTKSITNGMVSYTTSAEQITASFSNGTPTANDTLRDLSHTYFVIDRYSDGHFSPHNPNSIYRAPNSPYYTGLGDYIPQNDYDKGQINSAISRLSSWTDYWGYVIDGKKYFYTGTPSIRLFNKVDITSENLYNTEKFYVTIDADKATYQPEGKLYHADWTHPAYLDENQNSFYNPSTGDPETYVYHYRFHYGPDKHAFGGYYTYPYSCITKYDHYKPIKLYSGSVSYNYQDITTVPGYTYNGWVKISYTDQSSITDYPPSRPGGILANTTTIISGPSTDDYTPQNQLTYKYYYYKNSVWNYLGVTYNGTTQINWNPTALGLDPLNLKVGVLANDLYQDGPMGENDLAARIDITGSIDKSTVPAGDTINITAETDSNPDAVQVSYNVRDILSGNMAYQSKNPVAAFMYYIKGEYTSYASSQSPNWYYTKYQTYGIVKHQDGIEYSLGKHRVGNLTTGYNYTPIFYYFASNQTNLLQTYTLGKTGTIIIPAIDAQYSDIRGFRGIPCVSSPNNDSLKAGSALGFFSVSEVSSNGNISYSDDVFANPSFSSSKAFLTGGHKQFVQVFDKRIYVPYWYKPVGITFNDKNIKVYQDGVLIGTTQLNTTMEGRILYATEYSDSIQDRTSSIRSSYYLRPTGKHLFSPSEWSLDTVANFINGPYQDAYWDSSGGIRLDNPSYAPWLPGKIAWKGSMTVPVTMKNGVYNLTLTAVNGLQKSIDIPFIVSTPINPHGAMPTKVSKGSTYTATATSSKYVNDMKLIVFGSTYTMVYDGLNGSGDKKWKYDLTIPGTVMEGIYNQTSGAYKYAEFKATIPSGETAFDYESFEVILGASVSGNDIYATPGDTVQITSTTKGYCTSASIDMPAGNIAMVNDSPVNYYDNTWRKSYTVPVTQSIGTYDIAYKGTNAYMTVTDSAKLYVDVFLNPVGDIPDNIETKTNFKMKCTTTIYAASVTAVLNPTPGAAQYTLNLVSQDSVHKYWESANVQYPEMAAGGAAGKTVTAAFTAKAANGKTELCTDTGQLWEKIEVSGYELRRSLYEDGDAGKPIVESLSRAQSTRLADSVGFIMAGHEMGVKVLTKGYVDKIEMDFSGPTVDYDKDTSVKTLDDLTKRFEWDDPVSRNRTSEYSSLKDLQNHYVMPQAFSNVYTPKTDYHNIYTTYYLVPYGTKQSLHSWYTLREESGSAFKIDTDKLLERIKDPFVLKLKLYSGSRYVEKDIEFDVFERWDTLFNRDIRPYVDNPGEHDPMDKHSWETTDYIEDYFKSHYN